MCNMNHVEFISIKIRIWLEIIGLELQLFGLVLHCLPIAMKTTSSILPIAVLFIFFFRCISFVNSFLSTFRLSWAHCFRWTITAIVHCNRIRLERHYQWQLVTLCATISAKMAFFLHGVGLSSEICFWESIRFHSINLCQRVLLIGFNNDFSQLSPANNSFWTDWPFTSGNQLFYYGNYLISALIAVGVISPLKVWAGF